MKMIEWIQGKRTYSVAVAILVVGALEWYGYAVPEYVWAILGSFGLAFLRAGIENTKEW